MRAIITISLFFFFLYAQSSPQNSSIEEKIREVYTNAYPSMTINSIRFTNVSSYEAPVIEKIDTRLINPLKKRGTVIVNDKTYLSFEIEAEITLIVTKIPLHKETLLTTANTQKNTLAFTHFISAPITSIENLSTKRYIPKNRVLTYNSVKRPYLIKKGEKVRIKAYESGIELSFDGIAQNSAYLNEEVTVLFKKKSYIAKVTGERKAVIE